MHRNLLRSVGDLQWLAGIGDEVDEQARGLLRIYVLSQDVAGAGRFEPAFTCAVDPRRFSGELTPDTAGENVSIDRRLAMAVRLSLGPRCEDDLDHREALPRHIREGPLEDRDDVLSAC